MGEWFCGWCLVDKLSVVRVVGLFSYKVVICCILPVNAAWLNCILLCNCYRLWRKSLLALTETFAFLMRNIPTSLHNNIGFLQKNQPHKNCLQEKKNKTCRGS